MENNNVLAVVRDRQITQNDVDLVLRSMDPQTAAQFKSEDGKKRLVQELVNQELFYLDAVDNRMDQDIEFLAQLKRAKADILKQYALNKLLGGISVDESELKGYYETNKWQFSTSESVKASHILVDSKDTAEKVLGEIKEGLSFEEAAQKYSSCPSKAQGGDLGFFERGRMVPEFEEAAFDMKINDISEPVKTQFGYHIIKLIDRKDPGTRAFDEVKDQIRQYVLGSKQQDVYLMKVSELKKKYKVECDL